MEHISDHSQRLDLNPRQIYIIVRKHNRKYLKTFKSMAKESQNDVIRYCIVDTTAFEEQPSQASDLYRAFLGENEYGGAPWDFIVREYPRSKSQFVFTCEHIREHGDSKIRQQLQQLRCQERPPLKAGRH